jgi:hypothetical protein
MNCVNKGERGPGREGVVGADAGWAADNMAAGGAGAQAPLVVVSKSAAYLRAEGVIREPIHKYENVLLAFIRLRIRENIMSFEEVKPR